MSPFPRYSRLLLDWAVARASGLTADAEQRFARELHACALEVHESQQPVFQQALANLRAVNHRKLFVDDERPVPSGWTGAKTAAGAILFLEHFTATELSLDHDLGEGYGTGYDIVCWLEDAVLHRGYPMPAVKVHSQNPVGRTNIQRVVDSIRARLDALDDG